MSPKPMDMDQNDFRRQLSDKVLTPHRMTIGEIAADGDVAVAVFEADEAIKPAARAAGWDGTTPLFRMSDEFRKALIHTSLKTHDRITAAWLDRKGVVGRIFVFSGHGTALVNLTPGKGLSFEPGSLFLDRERV